MSEIKSYRVTCSYCLGTFLTVGHEAHIARHGFSVQGQVQGQGLVGCWHTGPCDGFEYAHLGISKRGTELALSRIESALAMHQATLAKLQARPVLEHTVAEEKKDHFRYVKTGRSQSWDIKPGDPGRQFGHYSKKWVRKDTYETIDLPAPEIECLFDINLPAYDYLLDGQVREVQGTIARLKAEVKRYTKVIETWTPEQYAPVPVVKTKKGPVMHKQGRYHGVPLCSRNFGGRNTYYFAREDAQVTCSRCRSHMH